MIIVYNLYFNKNHYNKKSFKFTKVDCYIFIKDSFRINVSPTFANLDPHHLTAYKTSSNFEKPAVEKYLRNRYGTIFRGKSVSSAGRGYSFHAAKYSKVKREREREKKRRKFNSVEFQPVNTPVDITKPGTIITRNG